MKQILAFTALVMMGLGAILAPIGCGAGGIRFTGPLDWVRLMSCSSAQQATMGDLQWMSFTVAGGADARPGDILGVTLGVRNSANVNAGDAANIGLPSNLRVFLSFDDQLDENDYLIGEFVLPGLPVNRSRFVVDNITVPRPTAPPNIPGFEDQYFPIVMPNPTAQSDPNYDPYDPTRPEYIGPVSIVYNIIGVLDSQNCIAEADGAEPTTREDLRGPIPAAYDPADIPMNNQILAGTLEVFNPNLANLQINFIDVQPTQIPQGTATVVTEWEVLNSGIGPVNQGDMYGVRVYWSADDRFDNWDRNVVVGDNAGPDGVPHVPSPDPNQRSSSNDDVLMINGPLFGNSNTLIIVECHWPYSVFRMNTYNNFFSSLEAWVSVDSSRTRTPPPNGPPGYDFLVYNPIPTNNQAPNFLIGQVDATDLIRESVEFDNYSTTHGELQVFISVNAGPFDLEPVEVSVNQQGGANALQIQVRYNSTLPAADQVSIGFYLSVDDQAQSSDYFCERFWYQLLGNANGALLNTNWTPNNFPEPGTFYMIAVLDDIFKFLGKEPKDNNFRVSTNTFILN